MNRKFNLSIDKPCNENFNQFESTVNGGFCFSCQKEVIDFSKMSDKEIIDYFQKNRKNVCGQFKQSQLKVYSDGIFSKEKHRLNWLSASLISFSLLSILPFSNIQAQKNIEKQSTVLTKTESNDQKKSKEDSPESFVVKGIVMDEHDPLIGVNIVLKGTNIGTTTDFDGKFVFSEPLKKGDILIFNYIGYNTKEYIIKESSSIVVNIKMSMCEMIMMGEVVVEELKFPKRSIRKKLKR